MKDIIIILLSILVGSMLLISFTMYSSIKYVANYDINREHLYMEEVSGYSYCPYCGEYIGERESEDK